MDKKVKNYEHQQTPQNPPAYLSNHIQIGLDRLSTASRIDVTIRDVVTAQGEVIFTLRRELKTRSIGNMYFELYDTTERLAISNRPVISCLRPGLDIFINDQLASKLTMKSIFTLSPTYFIRNAQGTKLMKIRAPTNAFSHADYVFRLKDMQGQQIGAITKKWNGLANEMYMDTLVYEIDFPADLEVPQKAAVIGFCILIIQDAIKKDD